MPPLLRERGQAPLPDLFYYNWSMTPPSVSVVITTYNRSKLLPRAIESAQNAGTDLDDTPEVCAQIPGIRFVRLSANSGLANARNVGIAESSSEFIAFLDDDDLRLPGSLDKQLRAITADERIALWSVEAASLVRLS